VAWVDRADRALYRAKAEGRNRCVAAAAPEP
jgi:PleD family two-component response regulator